MFGHRGREAPTTNQPAMTTFAPIQPVLKVFNVVIFMTYGNEHQYETFHRSSIDAVDAESACQIMQGRHANFIRVHKSNVRINAQQVIPASW
jgi:hypothetical protein